jgi:DNA-directed RNA polymerase specialized sigma54-like protein
MESDMNDNESPPVMIIVGRAKTMKDGESERVHILLVAPDDDTAVRSALEALAREGYVEAELDQIGEMEGMPDEEPHASAYQGALEGEIAIVTMK